MQPLILGVDFLEYTNADIKWSKHTISFYEMVKLPILEANACENVVQLISNTTLPPRSENLVQVKFQGEREGIALIESIMPFKKQQYTVGKILVEILPQNKITICKILNLTIFQIKIKKDRSIGRIMKLVANSEILN